MGSPPTADDIPDECPGEELYGTGTTDALEMFAIWAGESMPAAAAAGGEAGEPDAAAAERNSAMWSFLMRQLAHYRALPGRLRGRLLWQLAQMRAEYSSYLGCLASFTAERKRGR